MKTYFKTFGETTLTTAFEAPLFGRVAGTARALGVDCIIATKMVDDEQQLMPMVQACLTGTKEALDECLYQLWETFEVSEDVA